METESGGMERAQGSTSAKPDKPDWADWADKSGWAGLAILVLAALLRLAALDAKPAHFDEGVNGYFVDAMTRNGFYQYDPTNFHGPLHFYVLHLAQTLLGRGTWALRLPLALASIACVAVMLWGFRRFISVKASRLAALAMAVSPGFAFYGRYAIHETWLVLFLMLLVIGLAGMWRDGRLRDLWLTGIGFAGIVLTKETWVIHALALGLGGATLALLERVSPSSSSFSSSSSSSPPRRHPPSGWDQDEDEEKDEEPRRGAFTTDDVACVATICAALVIFFYSGGLLDPSGVRGFVQAYMVWTKTGTAGESGHEHPWTYWFELLGAYEWPALLGVVAAVAVVLPRTNRFVRWLAISALGTLVAYAIIPYKTPWCLIAWAWPFLLVFGVAAEWVSERVDRWIFGTLALAICAFSLAKSRVLNFERFADETEPYVYVQTTLDIHKLLDPLRWQAQRDPTTRYRPAHVLQEDKYPLLWLLADRPGITWDDHDAEPEPLDADWLLIDTSAKDRVEPALTAGYFRETLQIRGMAPDNAYLYLRAGSFAGYYRDRTPDIPAKP